MPNPLFHIDIALESTASFSHSVIENNLGSYLLGSCSPDIRVITRGNRDDTHFAPISNQVIGTGTKNLFKAYPRLERVADLSERTQAFMAGYFSHLVADEAWIILIYRPYFHNREIFQDEILANVMDRAVQLEMDRDAVARHDGMEHIRDQLVDAHIGVEVDFLPTETLAEWRDWVAGVTEREFTWERLRALASRRQRPGDVPRAQEAADEFLRTLPEALDHLYQRVPKEALRSYRDTIIQEWCEIVREYLP